MVKASKPTVAIFGGSFDPPHLGHQTIVQKAVKELDIDKLLLVPAYLNPFKTSTFATAQQRLLWCHEIFDEIPGVSVESYEVDREESVKTSESVKHFNKEYHVKYLIIGSDNLTDLTKWHAFEWLNAHIIWVIATRSGHPVETAGLRAWQILEVDMPISSTQIRDACDLGLIDSKIKKDVKQTLQKKSKDTPS